VSWLRSAGGAAADFDDVFSLRADLHDSYRAFYSLFWQQRLVDPMLLEVARLRIAKLNDCRSEAVLRYRPAVDAGMTERLAGAALEGDPRAILEPLPLACLRLAEKFTLDVHAIDDDDIAAVRDAIGEPVFVALIEAMALFDGFTRFRAILGVEPPPERGITIVDAPVGAGPVM
jgi:alkylhydroperoxidase family enzyme